MKSGPVIATIDSIITASDHPSSGHGTHPDNLEQHIISHVPQEQVPETALVDHSNDSTVDEESTSNVSASQAQSSGSTTAEEQTSVSSLKWKRKMKKALCGVVLANTCAVLGLVAAVVWWAPGYELSLWSARNDALQACYASVATSNISDYCAGLIASGVQKPPLKRRSIVKDRPDRLFAKHSLFRSGVITLVLASLIAAWIWSRPRLRTPRRSCISMARSEWSVVTVITPLEAAEVPMHCRPHGLYPEDAILVNELLAQNPSAETNFDGDYRHLTAVRNLVDYSNESLPLSVASEGADCNQEAESIIHTMETVRDESGDEMRQGAPMRPKSHSGSVRRGASPTKKQRKHRKKNRNYPRASVTDPPSNIDIPSEIILIEGLPLINASTSSFADDTMTQTRKKRDGLGMSGAPTSLAPPPIDTPLRQRVRKFLTRARKTI